MSFGEKDRHVIKARLDKHDFMYWTGGFANEDVKKLLVALDERDLEIKLLKENRQNIYEYALKRIDELMKENQRLRQELEGVSPS